MQEGAGVPLQSDSSRDDKEPSDAKWFDTNCSYQLQCICNITICFIYVFSTRHHVCCCHSGLQDKMGSFGRINTPSHTNIRHIKITSFPSRTSQLLIVPVLHISVHSVKKLAQDKRTLDKHTVQRDEPNHPYTLRRWCKPQQFYGPESLVTSTLSTELSSAEGGHRELWMKLRSQTESWCGRQLTKPEVWLWLVWGGRRVQEIVSHHNRQ